MDEYVKFNNQTAGRDKVVRFVQYCSRLIWYNCERRGASPDTIAKTKKLDETLGLMRRLLRFGRCVDTLHSAIPVMSTINDQVIRLTSALSRISSSCFMAIDHLVCLHKLGLLPNKCIDAAAWDKTSARFWLYSILLGLIRDIYEVMKVYKEACEFTKRKLRGYNRNQNRKEEQTPLIKIKGLPLPPHLDPALRRSLLIIQIAIKYIRRHADITIDLIKNVCDLFLPLTILGYVKLTPGTTSLLGIISTVASAIPQIHPMVKMVPAM